MSEEQLATEPKEEAVEEEKKKGRREEGDTLGGIIWALILIWAGVVFLVDNLGLMRNFVLRTQELSGIEMLDRFIGVWPLIMLGAGVLLLVDVVIRLTVPAFKKPVGGLVFLAVLLIGIALGDLINWNLLWPMLLILLGLSIIFRGSRRKI